MKIMMFLALFASVMAIGAAHLAPPRAADIPVSSRVEKIDEVRKYFGLSPEYDNVKGIDKVKIAILDGGFQGVATAADKKIAAKDPSFVLHRYLPESAQLIESYDSDSAALDPGDSHGREVAEVIWAMTGSNENGPQFHLYNAIDPENFHNAVKAAMAWGADIFVDARNWETYGNFDGTGFIDDLVSKATADPTKLWIQAAGNYGELVYNGPVDGRTLTDRDRQYVWFGDKNQWYLKLHSNMDENPVTITLSWNAFPKDETLPGTDKDLDLVVQEADSPYNVVAEGAEKQVIGKATKENESLLPRERVSLQLKGNTDYLIAVKVSGGTFDPAKDRLRITLTTDKSPFYDMDTKKTLNPIVFYGASHQGEIPIPADNPNVITVGGLSQFSAIGPTADGRIKPDVLMERTNVTFTNMEGQDGTSFAAAFLAGIAAELKAVEPGLTKAELLKARIDSPAKTMDDGKWSLDTSSLQADYSAWTMVSVLNKIGPDTVLGYKLDDNSQMLTLALGRDLYDEPLTTDLPDDIAQNRSDYVVYGRLMDQSIVDQINDPSSAYNSDYKSRLDTAKSSDGLSQDNSADVDPTVLELKATGLDKFNRRLVLFPILKSNLKTGDSKYLPWKTKWSGSPLEYVQLVPLFPRAAAMTNPDGSPWFKGRIWSTPKQDDLKKLVGE